VTRLSLRTVRAAAVLATLAVVTPACSPGYVLRAGYEEAKILWRRQPIEELLRQEGLDATTRHKLELVLRLRQFARDELALNVDGRYSTYATVDEAQLVHVVMAAERFRLEPYTWWFPIVGRVPYKGFFSEAEARAEAAKLEEQGFDTYVRSASAFSTLGWFDDPLLSTMIHREPVELADTVVHELLHSTIYIGGEASFDESFANFVGHRGAIAFFRADGEPQAARQAEDNWSDALCFANFLGDFAAALRSAYADGVTAEERAGIFARAQARFRALPFITGAYRGFASARLNNAIILHQLLYFDRLALFETAFERKSGDLRVAIHAVIDAASTNSADPFAALVAVAGRSAPDGELSASGRRCRVEPSDFESVQSPDADADGHDEHDDRQRQSAAE
jgi:predicted aminopeptidase